MKAKKLHVYYDKEADFLEINIGDPVESYCRDIGNGIYERIEEKTSEVRGIGILGFNKRAATKDINMEIPFEVGVSTA